MTTQGLAGSSPSTRSAVPPLEPDPPAGVHDLFGHTSIDRGTGIVAGLSVATREPYLWLRARVTDATLLRADDLSARVADRYRAMHAALQSLGMHPIRFWNYVPGIVDRMDGDIDRYMAFNRGRHQACAAVTAPGGETRASATASAVGVDGPDLVIDCLASTDGGSPVENPRQITSWRYSRRYGPRPPFFARGIRTTLDERPVLLLGGTASIVGEDSCHVGNVAAQIDELLTNMAVLISQTGIDQDAALSRLTEARIYVVDPADAELVESAIAARAGDRVRMQTARSRICRPELMVEVEGVAALGGRR